MRALESTRLLITDIGGVLIKTDEAIVRCIEQVFAAQGIRPGSREDLLAAFGVSIFEYIRAYLPAEHKHRAEALYEEFRQIYPDQARPWMEVFAGVDETLEQLKARGLKLAVLSGMLRHEVEANLSLLRFDRFDQVLALEDYQKTRPDPTGLQMIMQRLGVTPDQTAYIGDSVNDIRMARNAGVRALAVRSGAQDNRLLEAEQSDALIDSFADVIEQGGL